MHLGRRAVKDFVFADGTLIPAGSDLFSNAYGMHFDEELYPSSHSFNGFRFVQEDSAKQIQLIKPGLDYVPFGYGKHAWYVSLSLMRIRILFWRDTGSRLLTHFLPR